MSYHRNPGDDAETVMRVINRVRRGVLDHDKFGPEAKQMLLLALETYGLAWFEIHKLVPAGNLSPSFRDTVVQKAVDAGILARAFMGMDAVPVLQFRMK